jgi:hypothetical protein
MNALFVACSRHILPRGTVPTHYVTDLELHQDPAFQLPEDTRNLIIDGSESGDRDWPCNTSIGVSRFIASGRPESENAIRDSWKRFVHSRVRGAK